jgi:hypothetical protein
MAKAGIKPVWFGRMKITYTVISILPDICLRVMNGEFTVKKVVLVKRPFSPEFHEISERYENGFMKGSKGSVSR